MWNVNGLGHPIKRRTILSALKANWNDVRFLQEKHLNPAGVITLINKNVQFKFIRQDAGERILILVAEIQTHTHTGKYLNSKWRRSIIFYRSKSKDSTDW